MIPSSSYRRGLPGIFRIALCMALACMTAACGTAHTPSLTAAAALYRPISIASGVPARPGALAWSPDGARLAFISDSVTVVDLSREAPATERIDIAAPRFLAWGEDGALSVLTREGSRDILFLVDTARHGVIRKALDRRADAVYPLDDRRSLLLSLNVTQLKFGTEVSSVLSLLDLASGTTTTLHSSGRILPANERDEGLLTAWAHAGPNPLDGSFLLMEHFKPPVAAPYSRVRSLDLASSELQEISSRDQRTNYLSAGWSPDGRTIALTGPGGRIEFRDLQGGRLSEVSAPGLYPAWHPAGDLLALGGTLVSAAAGSATPLLANGGESISRWSPDGTRLALVIDGTLLLFRNIGPQAVPSSRRDAGLKKNLLMLQELLREDLITRTEYQTRRSRLLSDKKGGLP